MENLVEVRLKKPDDFLRIKETLTRIGVASNKDKRLYQSCHILHKQGRYYILHFKELFMLDGKNSSFGSEDLARRNTIVKLLSEWNIVDVVNTEQIEEPQAPLTLIKIIPFREKSDWTLLTKYTVGKKRKTVE
jgi:hypothetical protein